MTKAEVALLFSNLDTNNDGKLLFEEFVEGMKWLNRGMKVATTRDQEAASSSASSSDRASEIALQDALDSNKILLTVRPPNCKKCLKFDASLKVLLTLIAPFHIIHTVLERSCSENFGNCQV